MSDANLRRLERAARGKPPGDPHRQRWLVEFARAHGSVAAEEHLQLRDLVLVTAAFEDRRPSSIDGRIGEFGGWFTVTERSWSAGECRPREAWVHDVGEGPLPRLCSWITPAAPGEESGA